MRPLAKCQVPTFERACAANSGSSASRSRTAASASARRPRCPQADATTRKGQKSPGTSTRFARSRAPSYSPLWKCSQRGAKCIQPAWLGLSSIARRTIAAPRSNSPVCTIWSPRIPTASVLSGFRAIARSAAGPNAARSWRKKWVCASETSANWFARSSSTARRAAARARSREVASAPGKPNAYSST